MILKNRYIHIKYLHGFILIMTIFVYLFPVYLIIINSFKPFIDIFDSFISFPKSLYLDNYVTAIRSSNYIVLLKNNILLTIFTVSGILLCTSMAGYKVSRVKSKVGNFFYMLFSLPLLIPFYSYMIPLVTLINRLNLMNNLLGVALVYIATSSFSFFMFHGFVKTIPTELDESAKIDGCSEVRLFFSIILPLLKPVVSSVAVLFSIWTWNDFLLPFLILNNKKSMTITINVYKMFGKYGSDWDVITAGLVLASIPMLILYAFAQKNIIKGIVAGAVKG